MGLTHFPNGISSFGIPMMGNIPYFLPKDAKVYFVDKGGSDGNDGTYEAPYLTGQQAVNQIPQGGAAGNTRGNVVMIGPGLYEEEIRVIDRRYITLCGAGRGRTILAGGNTSGGGTSIQLVGQAAITGHSLMIASRGIYVMGFTFRGVGSANGIYIGDGGRIDSTFNYVASDIQVFDNAFDGDLFAGNWGMAVDGAYRVYIFGNAFHRWVLGGIHGGSGINRATQDVAVRWNHFMGCRGIGVDLASGTQISNWCTGPGNVFADDGTTAMTFPARYGVTGAGINWYVGNYEACDTELSAQASDWAAGNYEGTAGGTMVHVSTA